ncbi:MAG TPA: hypothetical protein PLG34_01350 [Spirochaetota bacterium]|jgi:hypothetical protein|nr:MAG: hypothetical protein BWX91_00447 [Spirochaetes bacterium ADurb.Bin133]HNZ26006.1 hypothetical protein [Spirochaetota bacterium]HPY86613.1 hypothetical protein [Spirochaetota bacterium]HQB60189.1 hypothetical protein [Spirochaetota bacterium]
MSEKLINLDNLNDDEIKSLYEVFLGKILMKREDFSYRKNLLSVLSKENVISSFVEKLNGDEFKVLKFITNFDALSNHYLIEKISIILDMQLFLVNKVISNLLLKSYIFQREDLIIIPQIYYEVANSTSYEIVDISGEIYSSKSITDINNIILYFITKEFKFSNSYSLYKKDNISSDQIFANYSNFDYDDLNAISYFFSNAFCDEQFNISLNKVEIFFSKNMFERILYFVEITFPNFYSILKFYYKNKQSVAFKREDLKKLWELTLMNQTYTYPPIKKDFDEVLSFLEKIGMIRTLDDGRILIICYYKNDEEVGNGITISTNFTFFVNANSTQKDYYEIALFGDMLNYNKLVEFEISELSIKRSVVAGYNYDNFQNFFENNGIDLPKNVETTIKQWFDKYGSYFYSTGTLFFCNGAEKGKLIKNLIEKDVITAYELIKDEVYIIPDENKEDFFNFLEKSGINFFNKEAKKNTPSRKNEVFNIESLINTSV